MPCKYPNLCTISLLLYLMVLKLFPQAVGYGHLWCYFYLFGVLRRFQHCTCHITMGSWKGRRNQYMQLVKVLYSKLSTNCKQLPTFPLEVRSGTELRFTEVGGESVTTLPQWPLVVIIHHTEMYPPIKQ